MIDGTGVFYAEGAGHAENLAEKKGECQNKRPDPKMQDADPKMSQACVTSTPGKT